MEESWWLYVATLDQYNSTMTRMDMRQYKEDEILTCTTLCAEGALNDHTGGFACFSALWSQFNQNIIVFFLVYL